MAPRERAQNAASMEAAFTEKSFYLAEFRGRTLVIAASAEGSVSPAALEAPLKELEANGTSVVLMGGERAVLDALTPGDPLVRGRRGFRGPRLARAARGVPGGGPTSRATSPGGRLSRWRRCAWA